MVDDIDVRIGAETGGLEQGADRAERAVEDFGAVVKRTQNAIRAFAEDVERAFRAPSNSIVAEAQRTAASLERLERASEGAARGAEQLRRAIGSVPTSANAAAAAVDRASAANQRYERTGTGARAAVTALASAFALLGVRDFAQDIQDAAFAQFGFEAALTSTTGSANNAGAALGFIEERAEALGLVVRDSVAGFIGLSGATRGTRLEGQATRDIWNGLVTAGVALNRSNEQLRRGQEAVTQIASKGVVSMEEIRQQLSEAIPGAVQIGARAMGLTTQAFNELVASGELLSEDFLPRFAAQLQREFGATLEQAMNQPLGQARRELAEFSNSLFEVQQAAGSEFLMEMTVGLREFREELSSEEGLQTARDLGRTLGEAFTSAARAAVFLADNIDTVVAGAQLLAGGFLIRFLVTTAAEARAAAIAYSLKGAAARSAAATATAGAATETAANLSLTAGLRAQAVARVQQAQLALVSARAEYSAALAAQAEAGANANALRGTVAYTEAKVALTAANARVVASQTAVATAAVGVAAAETAAAGATTLWARSMVLARGAASGLLALMGGPWGAALLAAGAAVYFVARAHQEQERRIAENRDRVLEMRAAYDRQAAAQRTLVDETSGLTVEVESASVSAAKYTGEVHLLADAHYRAAAAAKAQAIEELRLQSVIAQRDFAEARQLFNAEQSDETVDATRQALSASRGNLTPQALAGARQAGQEAAMASEAYETMMIAAANARQASQQLRDELERPLASYLAEDIPASGSATGGGSGGGAGSRTQRWQEELDRMIIAEGDFHGDSRQMELEFWQSKLAMTTAGSQDRLAVEREIYSLRRSMADDELRAQIATLEEAQAAAQGSAEAQLAIQDELVALMAETYGEDSQEFAEAQRERVRIAREATQERIRIEEARLDAEARAAAMRVAADEEIARIQLENERSNLDLLNGLGLMGGLERAEQARVLGEELRRIEMEAAERQYEIARQLIEDKLALEGLLPDARRELNAQLEELDREHAERSRVMQIQNAAETANEIRDIMREAAERWREAAGIVGDGVGDILNNAVTGARSFEEVWQSIGTSALNAVTGAIGQMVENWIAAQFAMTAGKAAGETARAGIAAAGAATEGAIVATKTGVHIASEGVRTGATAAGAAARVGIEATAGATTIGISAATALADVANNAVRAAAGAYAAIAGIPVIGPVLAPLTAAAALAGVLALGKSIFSARGGAERVANDGDMYELHRDEMVLPAYIANPLRSQLGRVTTGPLGLATSYAGATASGASGATAQRDTSLIQSLAELIGGLDRGGGGDSYTVQAWDGPSMRRFLRDNAGELSAALAEARRNGK